MKQWYKPCFTDRRFVYSLIEGFFLLGISLIIQFFTSAYVNSLPSTPVADLILSNTRVRDVDGIFVWGTVFIFLFVFFLGIKQIQRVPFIIKSVALFTLIRSVFVVLTHISAFPTHVVISSVFFTREAFNGIFTGNDLFFSGHTGLPFLLALMFWDSIYLRYIFLFFSGMFATVVLLGHIHYSIDVLSAFFITYSIFQLCKFFFKKDWELFGKKKEVVV